MATAFNLTAQLNLRGPSNLNKIVSDIRKQIGTVQGNVDLKINATSIRAIGQLNVALQSLNRNLDQTRTSAASAASAISSLVNASGSINRTTSSTATNIAKASSATANLTSNAKTAARSIVETRSEMEEFGRQSALAVRRFAAFSAPIGIILSLGNAFRQAFGDFVEFDKQLVKIEQVTDKTRGQLSGLITEITSLSTGLGVASSDLVNVAQTLAQAGLSAKDTEKALRALALSDLAPSFDNINDTVEGSIALMRQFGISAGDLEKALGSVNAVAAGFAVEASDLISAIQRTGGVFATASKGVSTGIDALNEFLAVFTSVRQTTRESAETIATGLRTIFTRIQREGTIEALREYGISLTDLDGKFVGAYKAVQLLSEGLGRLDPRDIKFSQIVEELGGFRQIGKVIPLIQQFAVAQEALKIAQAGQGSLASDAIKAQLSLANQISKVREEFLAFVRDIGSSDTFQTLAKGALSLSSGLIKIASSLRGVLPILAILGLSKGASAATQFGGGFFSGLKKVKPGSEGSTTSAGSSSTVTRTGTTQTGDGFDRLDSAIQTLTSNIDNLISSLDTFNAFSTELSNNTASLVANTASINALTSAISTLNLGGSSLSSGGKVLGFNKGGIVPGYGGGDKVPAFLEGGEVVINKKAVQNYGVNNLLKINKNKSTKFWSGGVADLAKIYPSISNTSNYSEFKNKKINDNSKFVPVVPDTDERIMFQESSGKNYEKFENFVSKKYGLGKPAQGFKFLDYPDARSEAKFMQLGNKYSEDDGKGNNPITIAAKNFLYENSLYDAPGNKENTLVKTLTTTDINTKPVTVYYPQDTKDFFRSTRTSKLAKERFPSGAYANGGIIKKFADAGKVEDFSLRPGETYYGELEVRAAKAANEEYKRAVKEAFSFENIYFEVLEGKSIAEGIEPEVYGTGIGSLKKGEPGVIGTRKVRLSKAVNDKEQVSVAALDAMVVNLRKAALNTRAAQMAAYTQAEEAIVSFKKSGLLENIDPGIMGYIKETITNLQAGTVDPDVWDTSSVEDITKKLTPSNLKAFGDLVSGQRVEVQGQRTKLGEVFNSIIETYGSNVTGREQSNITAAVADRLIKEKAKKASLGGLIQKFMAGGVAESLSDQEIETRLGLLGGAEGISGAIGTARLAELVKEKIKGQSYSRILLKLPTLRKNLKSERGSEYRDFISSVIRETESKKAGAASNLANLISQAQQNYAGVFGGAGMYQEGSFDSGRINLIPDPNKNRAIDKLKGPTSIDIVPGVLAQDEVMKQARLQAAKAKKADLNTQIGIATSETAESIAKQYGAEAQLERISQFNKQSAIAYVSAVADALDTKSNGSRIFLDFDKTLAYGADEIGKVEGSDKIDLSAFSDITKVKAGLGNAKLSSLSKKLIQLSSEMDQKQAGLGSELLKRMFVVSARPSNTMSLISGWLNSQGLNIPAGNFVGVGGAGLSEADIAIEKAREIISRGGLEQGSVFIDDDPTNIKSAGAQGIVSKQYGATMTPQFGIEATQKEGLDYQDLVRQTLSSYNQTLANAITINKQGQSLDFPNGLGPLASTWFDEPRLATIPTDVKRTITQSKVIENIANYLRIAKGYAFGGRAEGPSFDEVRKQIMDKYPEIDFRISKRKKGRGFGYNLLGALKTDGGLLGSKGLKFEQPTNLKQLVEISDKMASSLMNPQQLALGGLADASSEMSSLMSGLYGARRSSQEENKKQKNFGKIGLRASGSEITATYFKNQEREGMVTAKKASDNLYTIGLSKATGGYGPRLYDVVMEAATSAGGMLTSDRNSVSGDAKKVWDYYFNNRSDVKKIPLDPKDWTKNSALLDPKLYGGKETWPPFNDPAWVLQTGYSKSPSLIGSADVIDMNDPKYAEYIKQQQLGFLSRRYGGSIRFAAGGTVPAMVSNGEAYVSPQMAKKIGYSKLNKMNQADRNGMKGFSGGGISVFKGPGNGTSDSIGPIGLPTGSYIIREKATKALGLSSGGAVGLQKFAAGGMSRKDIQSNLAIGRGLDFNAFYDFISRAQSAGQTVTEFASGLLQARDAAKQAALDQGKTLLEAAQAGREAAATLAGIQFDTDPAILAKQQSELTQVLGAASTVVQNFAENVRVSSTAIDPTEILNLAKQARSEVAAKTYASNVKAGAADPMATTRAQMGAAGQSVTGDILRETIANTALTVKDLNTALKSLGERRRELQSQQGSADFGMPQLIELKMLDRLAPQIEAKLQDVLGTAIQGVQAEKAAALAPATPPSIAPITNLEEAKKLQNEADARRKELEAKRTGLEEQKTGATSPIESALIQSQINKVNDELKAFESSIQTATNTYLDGFDNLSQQLNNAAKAESTAIRLRDEAYQQLVEAAKNATTNWENLSAEQQAAIVDNMRFGTQGQKVQLADRAVAATGATRQALESERETKYGGQTTREGVASASMGDINAALDAAKSLAASQAAAADALEVFGIRAKQAGTGVEQFRERVKQQIIQLAKQKETQSVEKVAQFKQEAIGKRDALSKGGDVGARAAEDIRQALQTALGEGYDSAKAEEFIQKLGEGTESVSELISADKALSDALRQATTEGAAFDEATKEMARTLGIAEEEVRKLANASDVAASKQMDLYAKSAENIGKWSARIGLAFAGLGTAISDVIKSTSGTDSRSGAISAAGTEALLTTTGSLVAAFGQVPGAISSFSEGLTKTISMLPAGAVKTAATSVQGMLPKVMGLLTNPYVLAGAAVAAVAVGALAAAKAMHNAAKEFDKSQAAKAMENAMERVGRAFEDFEKDIRRVDLLGQIKTDLETAGASIAKGIKIDAEVPTAYWVNLFDALASGGSDAAQRSMILEQKGFGAYMSSSTFGQNPLGMAVNATLLGIPDLVATAVTGQSMFKGSEMKAEENRLGFMRELAPSMAKGQAASFKPVADATLRLFEEKLKTGTSFDDVMQDLKDSTTGVPSQLAENIARANPAIQEQLLLIDANNNLNKEQKEQAKQLLIAKEAEYQSTIRLAAIQKELDFEALQDASSRFITSLQRMFDNMDRAIAKTSFELNGMSRSLELSNAALSGQAKTGEVSLKSINVLQNQQAYSTPERQAAFDQAAEFSGSQSGVMRSLLQIGPKMEQTVLSTMNNVLKESPRASDEKIAAGIRVSLDKALNDLGLPADLSGKMSKEVQTAFADLRQKGDKDIGFDELAEKVPALSRTIDSAKAAQESAIRGLEFYQKNVNEYAQAMNQAVDYQLAANNYLRQANNIEIKGRMDLAKAFGQTISLQEQQQNQLANIRSLTGGATSPGDIRRNITDLNASRAAQQAGADDAANRGSAGRDQFILMQQNLKNTNVSLRENYQALKNLAESGDMASAALERINEIQRKTQAGVGIIEKLVTSSPEEINKFNKALGNLGRNMGGMQNASTAEERGATLQAFEMIAPLLGDSAQQNAIKANVLESMLLESGVGVNAMMGQVLDSLRNPEASPEMAAAVKFYQDSISQQAEANRSLASLEQSMADNTAEIAAEKLAKSIADVKLNFESQQLFDINNNISLLRDDVKNNKAAGAPGMSFGGIVYASAGQQVQFKPRGTDTVPAMLTPGEFVVNRAATSKNLPLLQSINNGYQKGGKVSYYQDGGLVIGNSWSTKADPSDPTGKSRVNNDFTIDEKRRKDTKKQTKQTFPNLYLDNTSAIDTTNISEMPLSAYAVANSVNLSKWNEDFRDIPKDFDSNSIRSAAGYGYERLRVIRGGPDAMASMKEDFKKYLDESIQVERSAGRSLNEAELQQLAARNFEDLPSQNTGSYQIRPLNPPRLLSQLINDAYTLPTIDSLKSHIELSGANFSFVKKPIPIEDLDKYRNKLISIKESFINGNIEKFSEYIKNNKSSSVELPKLKPELKIAGDYFELSGLADLDEKKKVLFDSAQRNSVLTPADPGQFIGFKQDFGTAAMWGNALGLGAPTAKLKNWLSGTNQERSGAGLFTKVVAGKSAMYNSSIGGTFNDFGSELSPNILAFGPAAFRDNLSKYNNHSIIYTELEAYETALNKLIDISKRSRDDEYEKSFGISEESMKIKSYLTNLEALYNKNIFSAQFERNYPFNKEISSYPIRLFNLQKDEWSELLKNNSAAIKDKIKDKDYAVDDFIPIGYGRTTKEFPWISDKNYVDFKDILAGKEEAFKRVDFVRKIKEGSFVGTGDYKDKFRVPYSLVEGQSYDPDIMAFDPSTKKQYVIVNNTTKPGKDAERKNPFIDANPSRYYFENEKALETMLQSSTPLFDLPTGKWDDVTSGTPYRYKLANPNGILPPFDKTILDSSIIKDMTQDLDPGLILNTKIKPTDYDFYAEKFAAARQKAVSDLRKARAEAELDKDKTVKFDESVDYFNEPVRVTLARLAKEFLDANKGKDYWVNFTRSGGLPTGISTVGTYAIEANQEAGNASKIPGQTQLQATWAAWSNIFGSLYAGGADNASYLKKMGINLADFGTYETVPEGLRRGPIDFEQKNAVQNIPENIQYFNIPGNKKQEYFSVFENLIRREVAALRSRKSNIQLTDNRLLTDIKRSTKTNIEYGNLETPEGKKQAEEIQTYEQLANLALKPPGKEGVVYSNPNVRDNYLNIVRDYYTKARDPDGKPIYGPEFIKALDPPTVAIPPFTPIDWEAFQQEIDKISPEFTPDQQYEAYQNVAMQKLATVLANNGPWAKSYGDFNNLRDYFLLLDNLISGSDSLNSISTKSLLLEGNMGQRLSDGSSGMIAQELLNKQLKDEELFSEIIFDAVSSQAGEGLKIDPKFFDPASIIDNYRLLTGNLIPLPDKAFLSSKLYLRQTMLRDNPDALKNKKDTQGTEPTKLATGGIVYASSGAGPINWTPRGTDTVPAMLTPGEFVINRQATQKHLPVLKAINSGNYNRGGIVNYLNNGGMVIPNYYQTGALVSGRSMGFDFAGFMQNLTSKLVSIIPNAIKQGLQNSQTTPQNKPNGVSSIDSSVLDKLTEFTNRLKSVADTLAGLDAIPSQINITGKHDVNIIINGDSALNQLKPDLQGLVLKEMKDGFKKLVDANQTPGAPLVNPFKDGQ